MSKTVTIITGPTGEIVVLKEISSSMTDEEHRCAKLLGEDGRQHVIVLGSAATLIISDNQPGPKAVRGD